jgi:hypothetical protein
MYYELWKKQILCNISSFMSVLCDLDLEHFLLLPGASNLHMGCVLNIHLCISNFELKIY